MVRIECFGFFSKFSDGHIPRQWYSLMNTYNIVHLCTDNVPFCALPDCQPFSWMVYLHAFSDREKINTCSIAVHICVHIHVYIVVATPIRE